LKREPRPARDRKPLVRIGPEPKARETVTVENIHGFLQTLLNDRDVRRERQ
jgi:hypothetical protein